MVFGCFFISLIYSVLTLCRKIISLQGLFFRIGCIIFVISITTVLLTS